MTWLGSVTKYIIERYSDHLITALLKRCPLIVDLFIATMGVKENVRERCALDTLLMTIHMLLNEGTIMITNEGPRGWINSSLTMKCKKYFVRFLFRNAPLRTVVNLTDVNNVFPVNHSSLTVVVWLRMNLSCSTASPCIVVAMVLMFH